MLRKSHDVTMDDVRFIANAMGKNDKELLIKESLLVKKLSPIMNGNDIILLSFSDFLFYYPSYFLFCF